MREKDTKLTGLIKNAMAGKKTETIVESIDSTTLHDLANEHAGLHWNGEDPMDSYGSGKRVEAADARKQAIENHVADNYGPALVTALRSVSNHAVPYLNKAHFGGSPDGATKSQRLRSAEDRLGTSIDSETALAHAYRHQRGE